MKTFVESTDMLYMYIRDITNQMSNLSYTESHGCSYIRIERVFIKSATPRKMVYAKCINVHRTWSHTIPDVKYLFPRMIVKFLVAAKSCWNIVDLLY